MRAEYICPVLTAFDENGKVDMEAMKRQFDHLIEGGLNGIAIMGSSGEFYAMTLKRQWHLPEIHRIFKGQNSSLHRNRSVDCR